MAKCGAKTRQGTRCKGQAMANGRCRMHGGKSTGAPKKPGALYSNFYTDEEKALLDEIEIDNIDAEIKLAKIRLRRALRDEQAANNLDEEAALEIEEIIETPVVLGGLPDPTEPPMQRKAKRKRDYGVIIDRLLGRINQLTAQKQALESQRLDIERKQIELEEMKGGESDVSPVKVVIQVEDASNEQNSAKA